MLDRSSNEGLTPWVEIEECTFVLELEAEEVELAEDAIDGSNPMKEKPSFLERIERNQKNWDLYYHTNQYIIISQYIYTLLANLS